LSYAGQHSSLDDHLQLRPLSRSLEAILTDAYMWGTIDLHMHSPAFMT
jgi:hypothetical protein